MIEPRADVCFVPPLRLHLRNSQAIRADGDYVLYWMVAARRTTWSFALDQAMGHARRLGKPLVILEALRSGYRWASDRLHTFVLEGMVANARRLEAKAVHYHVYVERHPGEGKGLLAALAERAAVVITDEFPDFFLPRMLDAASRLPVRLEAVDGNGLLPLRAADKAFARAVDFRRFLQKNLPGHLLDRPSSDPLAGEELPRLDALPPAIAERWPSLLDELKWGRLPYLPSLPIDHAVKPVEAVKGGSDMAEALWRRFLLRKLRRYQDGRLDLDNPSPSSLSPYLHFGHISPHQMFWELAEKQGWHPGKLSSGPHRGQREGLWGLDADGEAFLDQLVTWRELGYNGSFHMPDHRSWESLPAWARATLEEHAVDERERVYSLDEFEQARTHDEVWNAAQRQLRIEGTIHNYLRMLWGKKILEWTADPRQALDVMIELNNKYALDGRNPNSYSGIFWCLGRYDRAWGPERPIFGKIRYMTSDGARRKLRLGAYLQRFGPLSLV